MANYPKQLHPSSTTSSQTQSRTPGTTASPRSGGKLPHSATGYTGESPNSLGPSPEMRPTVTFSASSPPQSQSQSATASSSQAVSRRQRPLPLRIMGHWLFWMTTSIAITGGVAGFAGVALFKLPSLPNCPKIFWPTASASLRMHCAERAAEKNTPGDLLSAIALVDQLPLDHPMRERVNGLIEQWSFDILELAEVNFQQGDLEGSIAAAKRVPQHLAAYDQVDERIEHWQTVWAEAEKIYQEAEGLLEQEDLRGAFAVSTKLLSIDNEYWQTEQYNFLTNLIESSRVDTELLAEARRLAEKNNATDLLAAMELLETIQPDSRLYASARRTLSRFLEDLVDIGVKALVAGDSDTAMKVSRNLPNGVEFKAKARDLRELSFAISQASSGMVSDIESAILQAQKLGPNRPLYSNAQELVNSWELEIQDIHRLTRARGLAALGQVPDLQAAIAEAQLISYSNPRFNEAEQAIGGWRTQIYTLQDQPYLDEARKLADRGSIRALDAAISKAKLISEGRPLYPQAIKLIGQWTNQIQTMQDRPYLDDALAFASRSNFTAAIAAAQQIQPNRVLYDEAQANIQQWQDELNGDTFFRQANDIARQSTPAAWARAIRVAARIPANHTNAPEANRLMQRWGQSILTQAQQVAGVSYQEAIDIANLIPQSTSAYGSAQLQIETWQRAIAQEEQWATPTSPVLPTEDTTVEPIPAEAEPTPKPDDT